MSGSIVYNWPAGYCEDSIRLEANSHILEKVYDIVIVGAGVVGCALAYSLSQYQLEVLLVDRAHDVGEGTSKANSSIVHTGYDASPGTLESSLVTSASRSWPELARKLKIPFKANGALMVALDDEQESQLPALAKKSHANGVEDIEVLGKTQVLEMEPFLSSQVRGGIHVPRESIADVFQTSIGCAEAALENGVDILLGFEVVSVSLESNGLKTLNSLDGRSVSARFLVNAAGLQCQRLARTYGGKHYDINPRRGQFIIYDRLSKHLVQRILLPVPTPKTKGVLVSPTIYGNLLAGPTAEDLASADIFATQTTKEGIEMVMQGSQKLCPALAQQPIINTFAGLRSNCAQGSYQIEFNDGAPGIVTLNGIRSTGFTSSFQLAEHVIEGLHSKSKLRLKSKEDAKDSRPAASSPGWQEPRPFENEELMSTFPAYGEIVCYCEEISEQEILNAINSKLKPRTMDSIKRRTMAMKGRCQGYNCAVEIAHIIHKHCGIPVEKVTKKGPKSEILY